jgi:hypothetical protein
VYGVLGGGRLVDEFRQGTLARLQLPAPPPQFRGNRERVARDAERERLILEWELGMRSLRTHNPVWAAAQPAALSAPLYHAFTIPGEPYGLGESSLLAFLRCLTWSAESGPGVRGRIPFSLVWSRQPGESRCAVRLPACQRPTGNSPCTSLSANSSIMLRSYSSIVSIWMPAMRSRRRVRVSGASMSMA